MSVVAEFLDWGSIVLIGQLGGDYRGIVLREVRTRTRYILAQFFSLDFHESFWSLLEYTDGCLFNGIVRTIMMAGDPGYRFGCPPQMDIIVPSVVSFHVAQSGWRDFLMERGYTTVSTATHYEPFESCTRVIEYYRHAVSFFSILWSKTDWRDTQDNGGRVIAILFGDSIHALNVALHSPSTDCMNLLTSRAFYELHPRLNEQNVAIKRGLSPTVTPIFLFSFGLRTYYANSEFYRDCSNNCPVVWREVCDSQKIRQLVWQQGRQDTLLAADRLQWRLGQKCSNHACPNSQVVDPRPIDFGIVRFI
jgi:hypothetical protein